MAQDLDLASAMRALESGYFNLIRRGADGSLVLSMDRWRLETLDHFELRFVALDAAAPPLTLALTDVERTTWDRLPKQQTRSQVRLHLRSGDLWTFSGSLEGAVVRVD